MKRIYEELEMCSTTDVARPYFLLESGKNINQTLFVVEEEIMNESRGKASSNLI